MPENPDWDDVQAYLAGEDEAFTRLIRRHEAAIATQMRRFARDAVVREQLVQDVFVEAYTSLERYRPTAPFLHWLRVIATRVGYRYWRAERRRPSAMPLREEDLSTLAAAQDEDAPARAEAVLHALFARLAPKERLVLTLLYLEGCPTGEIAQRMGWTRAAVKMRAHRARNKLKALLRMMDEGKDTP